MKEQASTPSYKRNRFLPAIIGHAVWLSFRLSADYACGRALAAWCIGR